MKLTIRAAIVGALPLLVLAAGELQATPPSPRASRVLAPAVRQVLRSPRHRSFIVQLREPVREADWTALERAGARIVRRNRALPMAAVVASGTGVTRLAELPCVTRISPDLQVRRALDVATAAVGAG